MKRKRYELTLEQERLSLHFKKKWDAILFSTQPINREKSLQAIYQARNVLNLDIPKVVFCQSPLEAVNIIAENELNLEGSINWVFSLDIKFGYSVNRRTFPRSYAGSRSSKMFVDKRFNYEDFCEIVFSPFFESKFIRDSDFLDEMLDYELNVLYLGKYDFLIEEFGLDCDREIWQALKSLAQECPYTFAFKDICIVIERLTELHFDRVNRLHAEGKPAVRFIDGFGVYAFHGHTIPKKYGKYPYEQWQPQWFLEDDYWRPRIELLRGIGYDRFHQEIPESQYPSSHFWYFWEELIEEVSEIIRQWYMINFPLRKEPLFLPGNEQDIRNLPFKIPDEFFRNYRIFKTDIEIAPNTFRYNLDEACKNYLQPDWLEINSFAFPLFYGNNKEVYYVVCYPEEKKLSEVWYMKHNSQPKICGINVTSLILSIAECYETGAYYLARNEETGESSLQQDRSKVETIFRKFNPDYIEVWQEIWDENLTNAS